MLTISERDIRRHGAGGFLSVYWRQRRTERALRRRGIRFRTADPNEAAAAYAAMSDQEFDAINSMQEWANWRTIPRALNGHVPERALRVLDLGCGTGSSTRVLAFYCPDGSHLTGYEFAEPLLRFARQRKYLHRSKLPARVDFQCQGVTDNLLAADKTLIAGQSVDVVNASGVVGHHLTAISIPPLADELQRVLRPGGVAMLDVGPTLSAAELTEILTARGFHRVGHYRSWLFDPTGQVVFRRA